MGAAQGCEDSHADQCPGMGVKWAAPGTVTAAAAPQVETKDGRNVLHLQYNWHALMIQGNQSSRKPTGIASERGHSLHRLRHKFYLLSGDVLDCYETTKERNMQGGGRGRYQKQRRY